ncbi:RNA polymerase sigma factor [Kribbella sp. NPDC020789]
MSKRSMQPDEPSPEPSERSGAAFQAVWAAHGDHLRRLAATILRNFAAAKMVVVDVISTRCAGPGGFVDLPARHELARLTYLRCLRAGAVDDHIPGRPERDRIDSTPASISILGLRVLAHHQRAAVALVEYGDHTCAEVSDLLGLPQQTTAQLLASGRRASPTGHEAGPGIDELLTMLAEGLDE